MDFKTFFENQDVQNRINELAVHYSGKKIVLYGAGAFANAIFENYNLSKLNIIAVADKRFENNKDCFFNGIKGISPEELKYIDCDIILISNRDYLYFKKILIDLLKKTPNELVFIEQLLRDDIEKRLQNLEKEVLLLRTLLQKSVDITKIPPAKGNLRKLQLIKTEILKKIDVILLGKGNKIIVDFAHTVDSIEKLLSFVRGLVTGRLITVFGCVGYSNKEKRQKMMKAAVSYSDFVIVTTDNRGEVSFEDIEREWIFTFDLFDFRL